MDKMTVKLLCLLVAAGSAYAAREIVSGATWTARNTGRHIQAHGAAINTVDGVYYMIGEDKTWGGAFFYDLACYSSTDLIEWSYEGAPLRRTASGDLGPNRIVERPKVLFNDATQKYVMYFHMDNDIRKEASVGVARSDTICGNYEYLGSFRPLGQQSRDIGMFKDDDGSGYLMTEDRPNGLRINALTEDYLNVTETVHLWPENIESPAILKRDGYYFIFGSTLSGWKPNDNLYSYSKSLAGPWSEWQYFAPEGTGTFQSQTTFVLPVGNTVVYMGDRWYSENLMRSSYIWLPMKISGTNVTLDWVDRWSLDSRTGAWEPATNHVIYEAEEGILLNNATISDCSNCSSGAMVEALGGPDEGAVQFAWESEARGRETVLISHINTGSHQVWANVSCNSVQQTIGFLPTGDTPGNATVHCDFSSSGQNTLFISGEGELQTSSIDKISVPLE